jgi:molybdopterin molybdotransferase
MRKGQKVPLPEGPLTDRALGFLASLGIARVRVRCQPRVLVLVTGNELVAPGRRPGKRLVFESNGLMLKNALDLLGLKARVRIVRDSPVALRVGVVSALRECDVLLTTGGVSVGERDWAKEAFERAGVRKVFWRVAQKPGGPLYFGRKGKKAVFGLPGNPAAVYSCFQLYVRPFLGALQGHPIPKPRVLPLAHPLEPLGKKTFFVKAKVSGSNGDSVVSVLGGQGSHLLGSMVLGDGLLEVPPGKKTLPRGTRLDFHPFHGGQR